MYLIRTFFIALCILLSLSSLQAQFVCNQGSLICIKEGTPVRIKGSFVNQNQGELINSSSIYISGNWKNDANTAVFPLNSGGRVVFDGKVQTILGTRSTSFDTLVLANSSIKQLRTTTIVRKQLDLDTLALHLYDSKLSLTNTDSSALRFEKGAVYTGRIQTDLGSSVEQTTAQKNAYLIPFYDSAQQQFAPLYFQGTQTDSNKVQTCFFAQSPDTLGWSTALKEDTICTIHSDFVFLLKSTNQQESFKVGIVLPSNNSPRYNGLSYWKNASIGWKALKSRASTYNYLQKEGLYANTAFSFGDSTVLTLAQLAPQLKLPFGDSSWCSSTTVATNISNALALDFDSYSLLLDQQIDTTISSDSFNWSTNKEGLYTLQVRANSSNCLAYSLPINITLYPSVQLQHSQDTNIIRPDAATLWAAGADFYEWFPNDGSLDCSTCATTKALPSNAQRYTLIGESLDGCLDTAQVQVSVFDNLNKLFKVPNVITPNQDGKNDTWVIQNLAQFAQHKVVILNRWGSVVFQSANYQNTFDGTFAGGQLPAGTYYYIIDTKSDTGVVKGDLTIIRSE